ncbi:MAG TPA: hypothetical protein VK846_11100 [Candidatus Limnocylindria bacterium]|nr:hypothetical protein [Candidatus Limnocylindria bacterium]
MFGQTGGRIDWANTSTTLIYTNDCNGNIGLTRGVNAYRFTLYLGPIGTGSGGLVPILVVTNSAQTGRVTPVSPTHLPPQFPPGTPLAFQIRGEAIVTIPGTGHTGESDVGHITPNQSPASPPRTFGTNAGQVGGFELRPLCFPYVTRRLPDGPFTITRLIPGSEIAWTNSWFNIVATRIRTAELITGPWTNLADVSNTNSQMTFALPPSATPTRFYSIESTNASPAQPLGSWHYQALDASGAVLAAGILSFTSNVPLMGSYNVTRIQNFSPHPAGTNSFSSVTLFGSNVLEVIFNSEFRLRGQMISSQWSGDWQATEAVSGGGSRLHGGRFITIRRN